MVQIGSSCQLMELFAEQEEQEGDARLGAAAMPVAATLMARSNMTHGRPACGLCSICSCRAVHLLTTAL